MKIISNKFFINKIINEEEKLEINVYNNSCHIGYLIPYTKSDLNKERHLSRFSRWRNSTNHAFLTETKTNAVRTQAWINNLWNKHNGILFVILDINAKEIGHICLKNISETTAEIDNLIRGEPGGGSLLIFFSEIALLQWAFSKLTVEKIYGRLFDDNKLSFQLHKKIGFAVDNNIPYKQVIKTNGEVFWEAIKTTDKVTENSRLVSSISLTKENFYKFYINTFFPNLNKILNEIFKKSLLQKKRLKKYFYNQNVEYYEEVDRFVSEYSNYLIEQNISINEAIDSYINMCDEMLKSQIYFMKYEEYPINDFKNAYDLIYNNESKMKPFMIGLALSQYLWSSHYRIFSFYKEIIKDNKDNINNFLEIGPGHGLFFKEAFNVVGSANPSLKLHAIDISATSIQITKSIINHFYGKTSNIHFLIADFLDVEFQKKFDFIAMGEVIEHVPNPKEFLIKLKSMLSVNGKGFVSTCVNCPTIDHVYHFKNIEEIQRMVISSGLKINKELVLPTENMPMEDIVRKKIAINYCALVSK